MHNRANCRYLAPARYDDEVTVRTTIGDATPSMVRFDFEVRDASSGRSLANGFSKHVFCGARHEAAKAAAKIVAAVRHRISAVCCAAVYS